MLRSGSSLLVAASLLATGGVVAAVDRTEAPIGQLLPGPIDIEPSGASDGALSITPPASVVALGPDRSVLVDHQITNATTRELTLDLTVRTVTDVTTSGPILGATVEQDDPIRLLTPGSSIVLGSGERAVLTSALGRTADGPDGAALALTASVRGEPETGVTSFVVVDDGSPRHVDPMLVVRGADDAVIRLANPGDAFAVVDLRVQVRSWSGRVVDDVTSRGYLVAPDGERTLTLGLARSAIPGPVTVEVAVAHRGEPAARTQVTVWDGQRDLLLVAGALLLVVAIASLLRVRARRRAPEPVAGAVVGSDTLQDEEPR